MFLSVLFISHNLFAACEENNKKFNSTMVQWGYLTADSCYISLNANINFDLTYRDYLVTSNGLLMVFNSFGDGPEEEATGARDFHFAANIGQPLKLTFKDPVIEITMSSKIVLRFNSKTGQLISMSNGGVNVSPTITPKNNGGVEITKSPVIYVDAGFALGRSPSSIDGNQSTIRNTNGKSCKVKNSVLFKNTSTDSSLRYTNEAFNNFAKQQCPQIF